jgi:hypothetical protein
MDWGLPTKLIVDRAIEQVGQNTEFKKRCRTYDITYMSQAQGNLKKILQKESSEKSARNGSD